MRGHADYLAFSANERSTVAEFLESVLAENGLSYQGDPEQMFYMPISVRQCRRLIGTLRENPIDYAASPIYQIIREAMSETESAIAPIILQAFDAMETNDIAEFLQGIRRRFGWPTRQADDAGDAVPAFDDEVQELADRLGVDPDEFEGSARVLARLVDEPTEAILDTHRKIVAMLGADKAKTIMAQISQAYGGVPVEKIFLYGVDGDLDVIPDSLPEGTTEVISGRDPGDEGDPVAGLRKETGMDLLRRMMQQHH